MQVALCFHTDGVVQGYRVLPTEQLPAAATRPLNVAPPAPKASKKSKARQDKCREDPEALEAFIQVALREIDANSDDVITVEEVEKWFDSLEEEVEDQ